MNNTIEIQAVLLTTELSKLKGSEFFKEIPKDIVKQFGLIQEVDLLPDVVHRYLGKSIVFMLFKQPTRVIQLLKGQIISWQP